MEAVLWNQILVMKVIMKIHFQEEVTSAVVVAVVVGPRPVGRK